MGCKFKLSDLPPAALAMIRPQDRATLGLPPIPPPQGSHRADPPAQGPFPPKESPREPKGPNKTEARYRAERLRGLDARYEAVTFRLANGHRYTPDWVVFDPDGRPVECHEIKGSYQMHSHGRARLAFDQARTEIPGLTWVWATWTGKKWKIG